MALIIATLSDISFSFTVHAHDIQVDRSLLQWKLRKARFIRSISDYNRRSLERMHRPDTEGKIEVIHIGIEPERYEHNRDGAPSCELPLILCIAAYKEYKGLPVLIEACRLLHNDGMRFRAVLIGHGPMQEELAATVRAKGLSGIVDLAGPKQQDEVARAIAGAALVVLPSIVAADGQMEGIPVALMEAMACGRAVISTAISGIPELVEDGVTGILVPPKDAAALAQGMRTLLEEPRLAEEMGRRGSRKVRSEFSVGESVSRLIARLQPELGAME
jgi:glycosyltransferase involved in cell wall biosynthesis